MKNKVTTVLGLIFMLSAVVPNAQAATVMARIKKAFTPSAATKALWNNKQKLAAVSSYFGNANRREQGNRLLLQNNVQMIGKGSQQRAYARLGASENQSVISGPLSNKALQMNGIKASPVRPDDNLFTRGAPVIRVPIRDNDLPLLAPAPRIDNVMLQTSTTLQTTRRASTSAPAAVAPTRVSVAEKMRQQRAEHAQETARKQEAARSARIAEAEQAAAAARSNLQIDGQEGGLVKRLSGRFTPVAVPAVSPVVSSVQGRQRLEEMKAIRGRRVLED